MADRLDTIRKRYAVTAIYVRPDSFRIADPYTLLFSAYSFARIKEYVPDRIRAEECTTQTFFVNVISYVSDV